MEEYAIIPAEDYFNGFVLGYTKGGTVEKHSWYDYGSIRWQPALCMLLVWLAELLIVLKGLRVYGKVAYFVTLSPYVVLTVFAAYWGTAEGAREGIDLYVRPDLDKLWVRALCG